MRNLVEQFGPTAIKRAFILGVIGAFIISFMVVNAITAESLSSGSIKLGNATFAVDADTTVTATGIVVNTAAVSSDNSEEATIAAFGALNNALTAGDYSYAFDVFESGVDTWLASQTYTIRVWETTSGVTTSLGTYNTVQGTAVAATVEGVTITLNLGSTVPDEFDIIVDKD